MEATLQEEMLRQLARVHVQGHNQFWTMVLKAVLPMHLAVQVCEQALAGYMPWHEAIGIVRWAEVSTAMLEHIAMLRHKQGQDKDMFMAETKYLSLNNMVQLCPLHANQRLNAVLDVMKMDITKAMIKGKVISWTLYEEVSTCFVDHLEEQWAMYSCLNTFGHEVVTWDIAPIVLPGSQGRVTPAPKPSAPRAASPIDKATAEPVNPLPTSTYSHVVVEGGAGDAVPAYLRAFTLLLQQVSWDAERGIP
jgi:hypothetical protein